MSEEEERARDILLGSNGFGEDAKLLFVSRTNNGYLIRGEFSDGEEFEAEGELSLWRSGQFRFLSNNS